MAKIQTIKNKDNVTVYPQTHTQAVYDANGRKLQEWMNEYLTTENESAIEDVNTSFEIQGNKTTVLDSNSTDTQYPAAKTVYDFVIQSIGEMAGQLKIEVVSLLPSLGENSVIYLVPSEDSEEQNIYNEYLYLNSKWELIGTTKIDLSNYATNSSVDTKLTNYFTTEQTDQKYAKLNIYADTTINVGRGPGTAVGEYSTAEGYNTVSTGTASHAEGYMSKAYHDGAHAEGSWYNGIGTLANEIASHAEGAGTSAYGYASHTEGIDTIAKSEAQHVQGKFNVSDSSDVYAHIVGNGTNSADSTRSNAHTLTWAGEAWYQGDVYVGSTSGKNKDEGSKKLATEEFVNNKITYGTTTLEDGVSELSTGTLYVVYEE